MFHLFTVDPANSILKLYQLFSIISYDVMQINTLMPLLLLLHSFKAISYNTLIRRRNWDHGNRFFTICFYNTIVNVKIKIFVRYYFSYWTNVIKHYKVELLFNSKTEVCFISVGWSLVLEDNKAFCLTFKCIFFNFSLIVDF